MTETSKGRKAQSRTVTTSASADKDKKRYMNDNQGRGYDNLYDIFPSYWKESWGQVPYLGCVRADSEFDAVRAAYDKNLVPYNSTFEPLPVLRDEKEPRKVPSHVER